MKKAGLRLLFTALFLTATLAACQGRALVNGDFESGTLSGWTMTYGTGSGQYGIPVSPGGAIDTNNMLNRVYSGNYACMLNSGTIGPHAAYARISQSQLIDPTNSVLEFFYAAVLDGSHAAVASEDAYMTVEILNGATPVFQRQYAYASSPAPLVDDGVPLKMHLPWTAILIDLGAYTGLTLTVQFTAYNCAYGGHSSNAYLDGFRFIPPTPTWTVSASRTISPTNTLTATPTTTRTITLTDTPTPTFTETPTVTLTPTLTVTPTVTPSCTITPTWSISPTFTDSPTVTPTWTISPTFTASPTLINQSGVLEIRCVYPNPFEDVAHFCLVSKRAGRVSLNIYNVAGEVILDRHIEVPIGSSAYTWDGHNDAGGRCASGIYLVRVVMVMPEGGQTEDLKYVAMTR